MANIWRRFQKWAGLSQRYHAVHVEDVPTSLRPSTLYLIGDLDMPWAAALMCPCGCGAAIQLSLIANDTPRWIATRNADRTITLHPSIWRTKGCRSHFFLRRDRILWTRDRRHNSHDTIRPGRKWK